MVDLGVMILILMVSQHEGLGPEGGWLGNRGQLTHHEALFNTVINWGVNRVSRCDRGFTAFMNWSQRLIVWVIQ